MKKLCVILAALLLCSCSKADNSEKEYNKTDSNSDVEYKISDSLAELQETEKLSPVRSAEGKELGQIERCGLVTPVPGGIVFLSVDDEEKKADIKLFETSTGETVLLGTVPDFAYECGYDRVLREGHLYLLVTTGDLFDAESCTQNIIDVDLQGRSTATIYSRKDATVYSSMTAFGDGLVFLCDGLDTAKMVNLSDGSERTVRACSFDNETLSGETQRHVFSDGDSLYILRCEMQGDRNVKLFIDEFNGALQLVSSREITGISSDFSMTAEDSITELRQPVSVFEVRGDCIYYENFSCSRWLGTIKDGTLSELISVNDIPPDLAEFTASFDPEGGDDAYFFWLLGNTIYRLDADGFLTSAEFTPPEEGFVIVGISRQGSSLLLTLSDSDDSRRDPETGERDQIFCYVEPDKLTFK